ncbi:hypothetical protein CRG98_004713, partial [Punica granatum]
VEISLCRVYKRPGVEDHPSLPRSSSLGTKPSSSSRLACTLSSANKKHYNIEIMERQLQAHNNASQINNENNNSSIEKMTETDGSCSSSDVSIALGLSRHDTAAYCPLVEVNNGISLLQPQPPKTNLPSASSSSSGCSLVPFTVDELHTIVNYQHQQQPEQLVHHQFYGHQSAESTQLLISPNQLSSSKIPIGTLQAAATNFSDRLWDWNPVPETNRPLPDQFGSHFK